MSVSKERKSALFLLAVLAIIAGVTVFIALTLRVDPVEESLKSSPVINTLWVFTDDDGSALATNVLVFYPPSRKAVAFDILGNTGAIFSSLGRVDRIDAVYKEKGIDMYRAEIEKLIGKKIPFTIEISLKNLEFFADYFGGLNVFVPFPVDETDEDGHRYLLPSGAVLLDGDKISSFLTYRNVSDASEFEDRKEAVFVSLLSALRDNRDIIFSGNSFSIYEKRIKSNIEGDDLYKLMQNITDIDIEQYSLQTITGSLRNVDGKTLLFPYYDGQLIKDIMNQTVSSLVTGDSAGQNRVYVLVIQNGTTEQGLARNTSFLMQSVGYEVLETANADRNNYERTEIINHIGNAEAAKMLGSFIHCTNIIDEEVLPETEDAGSAAKADFTIILGKDFDGRFVKGNGANAAAE
ncbi:MAG: LCP family protein [Treponema sp.]|nr:LCP family protein [Treponema sp.]